MFISRAQANSGDDSNAVHVDGSRALTANWNVGGHQITGISGLGLVLGSDAQGDVYYRAASGLLARLAPGTAGQALTTGGPAANPTWTTVSAVPTRVLRSGDHTETIANLIVDCDSVGGSIAITLPLANTVTAGAPITVSDFTGHANTHGITVQRQGGDAIEGDTNKTINLAYGSVTLYSDGVSEWTVSASTDPYLITGVVGGDLAGTLPNPTLASSISTAVSFNGAITFGAAGSADFDNGLTIATTKKITGDAEVIIEATSTNAVIIRANGGEKARFFASGAFMVASTVDPGSAGIGIGYGAGIGLIDSDNVTTRSLIYMNGGTSAVVGAAPLTMTFGGNQVSLTAGTGPNETAGYGAFVSGGVGGTSVGAAHGGLGGVASLIAGNGGAGSGGKDPGNGGSVQIFAGDGGSSGTGNSNGGAVIILGGNKNGSGSLGTVSINTQSPGGQTFIGRTGQATTITGPTITQSDLTATGGAISLTSTGASSHTSTAALTLTAAATSVWSTSAGSLSVTSAAALTLTGAAASSWTTSAGALTITGAAASTWSTAAGKLTLQGFAGVDILCGSATPINIGTTLATSVVIGQDGVSTTTAAGGTIVTSTSKAVGFTISAFVSVYYLTADSLAISVDDTLPVNTTIEFWHLTTTNAPGHVFTPTANKIAQLPGTGFNTSLTWPAGQGTLTLKKIATGGNNWACS